MRGRNCQLQTALRIRGVSLGSHLRSAHIDMYDLLPPARASERFKEVICTPLQVPTSLAKTDTSVGNRSGDMLSRLILLTVATGTLSTSVQYLSLSSRATSTQSSPG